MSEPAVILPVGPAAGRPSALHGLTAVARRYAFSVLGPISVSAAHFLASFIFLHELPPVEFGQFAFLLVVSPFLSTSFAGSLLIAPLAHMTAMGDEESKLALSTLLKAALFITIVAGALTTFLLLFSHTPLVVALTLAPYTTFTALRWFGRAIIFSENRPATALWSDLAYSVTLVIGLLVLVKLGQFGIETASQLMVLSAALGLLALGGSYLRRQFWSLGSGSLISYVGVWRNYTSWSLLGVFLSEMTANAHAYLVTFFAGPKAFAVLAVGALMMRPVSLVLGALPDFERPRMARAIANGDTKQALRCVNEFRTAGGAIWLGTLGLAAVLLLWFPTVLLKDHYDLYEVLLVIAVWSVIMAARVLRIPESILLQSTGAFKPLASIGTKSSIISVLATLALLLTFGPLAALGGILIGELVMTVATVRLFRGWKTLHA